MHACLSHELLICLTISFTWIDWSKPMGDMQKNVSGPKVGDANKQFPRVLGQMEAEAVQEMQEGLVVDGSGLLVVPRDDWYGLVHNWNMTNRFSITELLAYIRNLHYTSITQLGTKEQ